MYAFYPQSVRYKYFVSQTAHARQPRVRELHPAPQVAQCTQNTNFAEICSERGLLKNTWLQCSKVDVPGISALWTSVLVCPLGATSFRNPPVYCWWSKAF